MCVNFFSFFTCPRHVRHADIITLAVAVFTFTSQGQTFKVFSSHAISPFSLCSKHSSVNSSNPSTHFSLLNSVQILKSFFASLCLFSSLAFAFWLATSLVPTFTGFPPDAEHFLFSLTQAIVSSPAHYFKFSFTFHERLRVALVCTRIAMLLHSAFNCAPRHSCISLHFVFILEGLMRSK